jgi:hypothetical protein
VYFNRRNKRIGPLFQGVYKAVLVETEEQLLHLSRYIHAQVMDLQGQALQIKQPSSYPNYLGQISQEWVKPGQILSFFKTAQRKRPNDFHSYQFFVEEYKESEIDVAIISKLTLEKRS